MMTRKAHALGMTRTVYRNASGLPNDEQVTTARDQALLGRAIQERFPRVLPLFRDADFHVSRDVDAQSQPPARPCRGHGRNQDRVHSGIGLQPRHLGAPQQPPHRVGGIGRFFGRRPRCAHAQTDRGIHRRRDRNRSSTAVAEAASAGRACGRATFPRRPRRRGARAVEPKQSVEAAARPCEGAQDRAPSRGDRRRGQARGYVLCVAPSQRPVPDRRLDRRRLRRPPPPPPMPRPPQAAPTTPAGSPGTVAEPIKPIHVKTVKVKLPSLQVVAVALPATPANAVRADAMADPVRTLEGEQPRDADHAANAQARASHVAARQNPPPSPSPATPSQPSAHSGWIIQVGAFDGEHEAQEKLSSRPRQSGARCWATPTRSPRRS